MRTYNKAKPLIVIHIPKAAGTSTREIFKLWFKSNFHNHYYNENEGLMPPKLDLHKLHSYENPLVLHGHFNNSRGFGIEDYYPDVEQFITILRDPYEQMTSHYFYVQKFGDNWKDQSRVPASDLHAYLMSRKPNMLNHFPREMRMDNFKDIIEEYFIEIGITEKLVISLARIAGKLGFAFDEHQLQELNKTERDQAMAESFKELFIELNPLEFAVYDYVLSKYD